jgi:hypothetical protein
VVPQDDFKQATKFSKKKATLENEPVTGGRTDNYFSVLMKELNDGEVWTVFSVIFLYVFFFLRNSLFFTL